MVRTVKGLLERLNGGETVVCAEGYVFNFERRGYLQAGPFVPEVVIEHPELVKLLYEEMVHAGSDVVQAFTYYAHRAKLAVIDREMDVEKMNRQALKMARQVADETGTLMAGNICNTNIYHNELSDADRDHIKKVFREQVEWATEEGADFIVGETYSFIGEAMLALEAIKKYGNGLPAVITMSATKSIVTSDTDEPFVDALVKLADAGADVVGFNCHRGPATTLPLVKELRAKCKAHIAALPVPYRTTEANPNFGSLTLANGKRAFPDNLDAFFCTRDDIIEFTKECHKIGVNYLGICCGNSGGHQRAMVEALGRKPPASRYSPKMELHSYLGSDPKKLTMKATTILKDLM